MQNYPKITDWSVDGRTQLVSDHPEIRYLLDEAFSNFVDTRGGLIAFGFIGDDPVRIAVDWALDRFAHGDLDPEKLHPQSCSFRLFTEVTFWLAQKVGGANARRILRRMEIADQAQIHTAAQGIHENSTIEFDKLRSSLAATANQLNRRTCKDMLGYWLEGSEKMRKQWFGWYEPAPSLPAISGSSRSKHIADALFRFCVIFTKLESTADTVCIRWLFTPCENTAPYQRSMADLRRDFPNVSVLALKNDRTSSVAKLLFQIADCGHERPEDGVTEHVLVSRASIKRTILFLYNLERNAELAHRIKTIPQIRR